MWGSLSLSGKGGSEAAMSDSDFILSVGFGRQITRSNNQQLE